MTELLDIYLYNCA